MEASTMPAHDAATGASEPKRVLVDLLPTGFARVAVAVVGAALLAASFAAFGASGRALVGAVLCPVLVLLAAIDVKDRLLPYAIVFPATLLVALYVAASNPGGVLEHLEAGFALGGFLFLFATVFPGGLGMGDAKVGLLLGLALGSRTLSAMMLAFLGLFFVAVWILFTQGLSARTQTIPFGPFLAIGGIAAFFLT
jgi:prepilin signal peptidase PulO-like enzyme (type II secretory pathway)